MDNKVFDIAPAPKATPKPKSEPTKKTVQDNDDGPLSIPVRTSLVKNVPEIQPTPAPEQVAPETHHELKLDVPKEENEKIVISTDSQSNTKPELEVNETIENSDNAKTHAIVGAPQDSNPTNTLETEKVESTEPVSSPKESVLGDPESADQELQSPKIFDTKQYHLPIKENGSKSVGKHMLTFMAVFLLVVLVGGVVAIDAGWLDLGIKLPFDLIK